MSDPSPVTARLIRFGVFELDLRAGELRKAGVRLNLPDQPFQLLTALLERPGELVTREELRPRLWPGDTFVDFEHGLNAAVKRLRDVLGDSADAPRFVETMPRRGYRFIAPVNGARPATEVAQPEAARAPGRERPPLLFGGQRQVVVLLAVAVVAVATWWVLRRPPGPNAPMRVVPLTTLTGEESWPTFSPDGEQVAFDWSGEQGDNHDIYVTIVGSSEVRRLTTDPAVDTAPSWSPDGRQIAFLRCHQQQQGCRIRLMSPLGGSDSKLSDVLVSPGIAWSPDSRVIAAGREATNAEHGDSGIYVFPREGGEPRAITLTKAPSVDLSPAFSPDGRRLAYASCPRPSSVVAQLGCYVAMLDVDGEFAPVGPPRRLTLQSIPLVDGLTWSRDGASVVFHVDYVDPFTPHLWRVPVDGSQGPQPIELAGINVSNPATTPLRDRLAFTRRQDDMDVYRFSPGQPSRPVASSSVLDLDPQFSPDGRRIAFGSVRSGKSAIWVAAADGTGVHRLTDGPGLVQGSPHWSPDGRRIAFDSQGSDGHSHVWTIEADGGAPQQVTTAAGDQTVPTWSRDGRWIYFSASRGGPWDIWRIGASGGPNERVTRNGSGLLALESSDGDSLVYQLRREDAPVVIKSLRDGSERQLAACAKDSAFDVGRGGVYYVACGPGTDLSVHVVNPATGQERLLGTLEGFDYPYPISLSVSPDGTEILYVKSVSRNADLMLIENFR